MNVIITNKYASMLQGLDIDIIKSLNGEFDVEEIISTFQNFYFQRMILDITAIKNYRDIKNLQKLFMEICSIHSITIYTFYKHINIK